MMVFHVSGRDGHCPTSADKNIALLPYDKEQSYAVSTRLRLVAEMDLRGHVQQGHGVAPTPLLPLLVHHCRAWSICIDAAVFHARLRPVDHRCFQTR